MTREEFGKGWLVLVSQPWGKQYDDTTERAKVQREFYYSKFHYVNPFVWFAVCESHATGNHWPTVDELRLTIQHNTPQQKKLPPPNSEYCEMPDALRACFDYQGDTGCSATESYLAVLPRWIQAHPGHEDLSRAQHLLDETLKNKKKVKEINRDGRKISLNFKTDEKKASVVGGT